MREPEEIKKDLEAIRAEMKKRSPNSGKASVQKKFDELSKKDIELEKELVESLEQKYKMKKSSVYL
ncbi:MAG: hypothetical protein ABSC20_04030 [Candidatus Bathyarchaeia archaeon]|jgi:hypothetical protein